MNQRDRTSSSGLGQGAGLVQIALAYASLFCYGLIDNSRGPIYPDLLADFSLTNTTGSLFFFAASGAALLNNLLAFRWMEKVGALRTLQIYCCLQAVGLLIVGIGWSFPIVIVGSVVMGLALGGLGIAVNLLVVEGASETGRRRALSGLHAMYGVSSLLAPLFVIVLSQASMSWRTILGSLALGPIAVVIWSLFAKAKRIRVQDPLEPKGRPLGAALYYAAMLTFYVVAEILVSTRLVLYVRREAGFNAEDANLLLSGFFMALFAGRMLFALVSVSLENRRILGFSALASAATFVLGITVHPLWLVLTGFSMSMYYPCAIALINDEMKAAAPYTTSWCITLQQLGLMLMHFFVGFLSDRIGIGNALWIGPISLLLSFAFLGKRVRFQAVSPS